MRCITGTSVIMVEVLSALPDGVLDEMDEEFDDYDPTPVTDLGAPSEHKERKA
jgi:hypothetical protein